MAHGNAHTHRQMGSCNQGMSSKCGIHGTCSCCTILERRWHDCSIGGYDNCAQPIGDKNAMTSIPSMLCMYGSRCSSQGDPGWSYMQCGMILWHLLTSFFDLSFFLKSFILFLYMATLRNAQTKIVIVYMREQTWGTWDDMIQRWYRYGMVCMQWEV